MNWVKITTRKQSLIEAYAKIKGWNEGICREVGCKKIRLLFESNNGALTFYFEKEDLAGLKSKLSSILQNEKHEAIFRRDGIAHFKNMADYSKLLGDTDFTNKTNEELLDYYAKFAGLQCKLTPFIVVPTFVDEILEPKIKEALLLRKLPEKELGEYFHILALMKKESYANKEEKELLKIALANSGDINTLVDEHTKKYCWINIQAEEEPLNEKYFLRLVENIRKNKQKHEKRLKLLENYGSYVEEKKQKILDKIKPDKKELLLFEALENWAYVKDFRREMLSRYRLYSRNLFEEIGKRLGLNGAAVRNMLFDEIKEGISGKDVNKNTINERMKHYVLTNYEGKISLLAGAEANDIIEKEILKDEIKNFDILKGHGASPGVIRGVAKLILGISDMDKMNEGDILVARMTTPDIMQMMMEKAAAVVTDEGGALSHAAIVSRELGIPCIVGTNVATQVLKDGDLIEVDAHNGIVRIIK